MRDLLENAQLREGEIVERSLTPGMMRTHNIKVTRRVLYCCASATAHSYLVIHLAYLVTNTQNLHSFSNVLEESRKKEKPSFTLDYNPGPPGQRTKLEPT